MKFTKISSALYAPAFACALSLSLASSAAWAQGRGQGPGSPGQPSTVNPASIDDATVRRAAKAYVKVREIVQQNQQAFTSASNETQKKQIVQRIETSTLAAVKGEDLQPQQYNQVIELAQADTTFRQKFLSYVKDALKNSPNGSK